MKGFICNKLRGASPLICLYGYLAISTALHASVLLISFGSGTAEKQFQYKSVLNVAIPIRLPSDGAIQPIIEAAPIKLGPNGQSPRAHENSISSSQGTFPKQANTSDVQWYFTNELDSQPEPLEVISLESEFDSAVNETGQIHLSLLISNQGLVLWARIEESEFSDEINDLVIKKFLDSRFTPGIRNGHVVNSFIRIEVTRSD